MTPRIPPVPASERDEKARELLAAVGLPDGEAMNLFTTLVRHPRLFRRWLPFGGVLLTGSLEARQRELLILRTAHNTGAAYEWTHHVPMARAAGLTDEEIARVRKGPAADGWEAFDVVLLRAADQLHRDARVDDATWAALAERFDEQQLIELPMLVGQYHLVAFTLNSIGIELEPGLETG